MTVLYVCVSVSKGGVPRGIVLSGFLTITSVLVRECPSSLYRVSHGPIVSGFVVLFTPVSIVPPFLIRIGVWFCRFQLHCR